MIEDGASKRIWNYFWILSFLWGWRIYDELLEYINFLIQTFI